MNSFPFFARILDPNLCSIWASLVDKETKFKFIVVTMPELTKQICEIWVRLHKVSNQIQNDLVKKIEPRNDHSLLLAKEIEDLVEELCFLTEFKFFWSQKWIKDQSIFTILKIGYNKHHNVLVDMRTGVIQLIFRCLFWKILTLSS